jgi:uncharacterized protein (DUF1800 family)
MKHNSIIALAAFSLVLSACGGGGGSSDTTPAPIVVDNPDVTMALVEPQAYELNGQFAKFKIDRSGASGALSVNYSLGGSTDVTKGSASVDDYQMVYSDGGDVGDRLELGANQNSRVVEVRPIADDSFEVPETLSITLAAGSGYDLGTDRSAVMVISDATNDSANQKVFLGAFAPQNGAITNGSGVLSFILQGDNEAGKLSYSFSNLSAVQTDQHIHLSPSGTTVKDIEQTGSISNFVWDLAPGGIFVTEQQMLDALFSGEFYVNIHTADYPTGEISASLIFDADVEPPEESVLSAKQVNQDIIRFLNQATFGATPGDYEALRALIDEDGSNRMQVYAMWIEQQFDLDQAEMLPLLDATLAEFGDEWPPNVRQDSIWPLILYGNDQLRQRMAFALSEILVVSDQNNTVYDAYRGAASYWDMLGANAFGSYRQTLESVTRHPLMGIYLSHLRNQKANPDIGYYPDENFAREVMQLFTFGLVQRRQNGSIILGPDNLPIETYNNDVIKDMAKVFTGLSFGAYEQGGSNVPNNGFFLGSQINEAQYRWIAPMKFFPNFHEYSAKTLFADNGQVLTIAESSQQDLADADAELDLVLDALVSHSSTAPNISRKLIQRFVTSNPSAAYIQRVVNAFGAEGDLKAVIKAILLDVEARNPAVASSQTFGKIKEPVLQITGILRLLEAQSEVPLGPTSTEDDAVRGFNYEFIDQFSAGTSVLRMGNLDIGQAPLGAGSVFNFFSPDFAPPGVIASNSLVSPELQLVTESQLFKTFNSFNKLINSGFFRYSVYDRDNVNPAYESGQFHVRLNPRRLKAQWDTTEGSETDKAAAIVDYLDFYLNAGQLADSVDTGTRQAMISNIAVASENGRYSLSVYGVGTAPAFMTQK